MFSNVAIAAFFAGLAAAYHPPVGEPVGNPITSPLVQMVPAGAPFTITWQPDSPNKISLLLLKGPSSNVLFEQVIVEGIDNTGSFTWTPPTTLEGTEGPGGYGIQLIDDVDGHYQYSTQFGISNDAPVEPAPAPEPTATISASSVAAPEPTATVSASSVATPEGYAVSTSSAYEVVPSAPVEESSSCTTTTTIYAPAPPPVGTGTGAPLPPTVLYPTGPVTVPQSLKTSATGTGTGGYPVPTTGLPEFEGSASGVKAGLGLTGAIAALVFLL